MNSSSISASTSSGGGSQLSPATAAPPAEDSDLVKLSVVAATAVLSLFAIFAILVFLCKRASAFTSAQGRTRRAVLAAEEAARLEQRLTEQVQLGNEEIMAQYVGDNYVAAKKEAEWVPEAERKRDGPGRDVLTKFSFIHNDAIEIPGGHNEDGDSDVAFADLADPGVSGMMEPDEWDLEWHIAEQRRRLETTEQSRLTRLVQRGKDNESSRNPLLHATGVTPAVASEESKMPLDFTEMPWLSAGGGDDAL